MKYIVGYHCCGFHVCYETDDLDQAILWAGNALVVYERK